MPNHGNHICAQASSLSIYLYASAHSDSLPNDLVEIDYDGISIQPKAYGFDMPSIPKLRV